MSRQRYTTIQGLKLQRKKKKPEVAFWRLTEKDKSPINKFKSPEGIGTLKAGKQIQNFARTNCKESK